MGKVFGGFCAILGVFTLTLPIPIVVNSFAGFYKNRLWRNEVAQKKRQRMEEKKKLKRKSCTGEIEEEEDIDTILTLESREALAKVHLFENIHVIKTFHRVTKTQFLRLTRREEIWK